MSQLLPVIEERARASCARVIIGGDFNLPDINWIDMTSVSSGRYRAKSDALLSVMNSSGLEQLVSVPTRISDNCRSILDLVITNVPQLVRNVVTDTGISDHLAVLFQVEDVCRRPKVRREVKLFGKANFDLINQHMYQHYLCFRDDATGRSIDENWQQFKNCIRQVEKLVPSCRTNSNADPPWYSHELRRLDNKQRKLHRQVKQ